MKKLNLIKRYLSLFLGLIITLGACVVFGSNAENSAPVNAATYSPHNYYGYRIDQDLTQSPDTFMAWINITADQAAKKTTNASGDTRYGNDNSTSTGNVILSNMYNSSVNNKNGNVGSVCYELTTDGYVKVWWDRGNFTYTFTSTSVATGEWVHIAVVRDETLNTLTLYVNGIAKEVVNVSLFDSVAAGSFNIGFGDRAWSDRTQRSYFNGSIKQITIYNGAVSVSRIREDMNNTAISTDDERATLIGNWNLGETWTQSQIANSKEGGAGVSLVTFSKYITGEIGVDFLNPDTYDYMLVGLPDLQIMAHYRINRLNNLFDWIAENAATYKMEFAWCVGDLSDDGRQACFYETTKTAMNKINGILPYSFVQGNHDYNSECGRFGDISRNDDLFDTYFSYDEYSQYDGFAGAYEDGTRGTTPSMSNTYYLYPIDYNNDGVVDVKYLVLNLEMAPRKSVIRWAGRIADMYPDHRVIVNTHCYMESDGTIMDENSFFSGYGGEYPWFNEIDTTTAQELFDGLIKRHANMFMVFCGHITYDEIKYRTDTGIYGNTVTSFLIDAQGAFYKRGEDLNWYDADSSSEVVRYEQRTSTVSQGEDIILLMGVNETTKSIEYCYYSPEYGGYYNLQGNFNMSFADANNPTVGA